MALGSTQPLWVPGIFLGVKGGRPARKADLTAIYEPIVYKIVGASTSQNSMGLHSLLQG
jgi:hypothetical protein